MSYGGNNSLFVKSCLGFYFYVNWFEFCEQIKINLEPWICTYSKNIFKTQSYIYGEGFVKIVHA